MRTYKKQTLLFDLFKPSCYYRAVTNQLFSSERPIVLHTCALCSELPSNMNTPKLGGKTEERTRAAKKTKRGGGEKERDRGKVKRNEVKRCSPIKVSRPDIAMSTLLSNHYYPMVLILDG